MKSTVRLPKTHSALPNNTVNTEFDRGAGFGRYDRVAIWCSRALLMIAILISSWCIGGYYPAGRFITLAIAALAFGTSLFARRIDGASIKPIPLVLLISYIAVAYSAAQLVPLGNLTSILAPGQSETRADFASTTAHGMATKPDLAQSTGYAVASNHGPNAISISRWDSKKAVSTLVIGLIGMTMGWLLIRDDQSRLLLLIGFALCGATQVFWGVIQQVTYPDQIVWGQLNPGHSTPFGSFLNRNHAADFLGMSLACAIGLVIWCHRKSVRRGTRAYGNQTFSINWMLQPPVLASCLLFGWLLFGLLLTMSRGGWSSAILSIAFASFVWTRSERQAVGARKPAATKIDAKTAFTLIAVASAAMLFLIIALKTSGLSGRIGNRIHALEISSIQSDARWEHWRQALPAATHYLPFGSGLGTYGYAHLPFTESTDGTWYSHAHNQYLEILVETGLPGIAILISLLVAFSFSMRDVLFNNRTTGERAMGFAVLIAATMQLLHATVDFGLAMPANLLGLSVLMGAGLAAANPDTSKSIHKRLVRPTLDQSISRVLFPNHASGHVIAGSFLGTLTLALFVVPSLIHLNNRVSIEKKLNQTRFSDLTPAPSVDDALKDIDLLSQLIARFPDAQQPRLRRARLRMHVSRRKNYDDLKLLAQQQNIKSDLRELWEKVGCDNAIFILHQKLADTSRASQSELSSQYALDAQLNLAWNELAELVVINPMQSKTHLLLAKVAALTGREWKHHFRRLKELSSGDPETSFAIGLLALSTGDHESMLTSWRQTIQNEPRMTETIVHAARHTVLDEDVANRLMPEKWDIPYRLSLKTKSNDADQHFRNLLLRRASKLIVDSDLDEMNRLRAHFQVSSEMGDFSAAAEWLLKAVQLEPHDPNLRYQVANALVKSARFDEAKSHIRVGSVLAPHEQRFKNLLSNLKRREN